MPPAPGESVPQEQRAAESSAYQHIAAVPLTCIAPATVRQIVNLLDTELELPELVHRALSTRSDGSRDRTQLSWLKNRSPMLLGNSMLVGTSGSGGYSTNSPVAPAIEARDCPCQSRVGHRYAIVGEGEGKHMSPPASAPLRGSGTGEERRGLAVLTQQTSGARNTKPLSSSGVAQSGDGASGNDLVARIVGWH